MSPLPLLTRVQLAAKACADFGIEVESLGNLLKLAEDAESAPLFEALAARERAEQEGMTRYADCRSIALVAATAGLRDRILAAIASAGESAALVRMPLWMSEVLRWAEWLDPPASDGWERSTIGGVPIEITDHHVEGWEVVLEPTS